MLVFLLVYTTYKTYCNKKYNITSLVNGYLARCTLLIRPCPSSPSIRFNYNCHINKVKSSRTCLANHTESISWHWPRGGHTHKQTNGFCKTIQHRLLYTASDIKALCERDRLLTTMRPKLCTVVQPLSQFSAVAQLLLVRLSHVSTYHITV